MSLVETDCSLRDLSNDLVIVYAVSLGVFALGFLVLVNFTRFSKPSQNSAFGLTLFLLQVFLYVAFLLGQGAYFDETLGLCIPWARWITYTFSCALLAYEIAMDSRMSVYATFLFVAMISLTLLTGAISAQSSTVDHRWIWFGVGFAPYLLALLLLWRSRGRLFVFVLITWSFYPAIFALGPGLADVISLEIESALYLASDLITKLAFTAWMMYQKPMVCKTVSSSC